MEGLERDIAALLAIPDPLDRARMAGSAIDRLRTYMTRIKNIRGQALLEARRTRSATDLAAELGVGRQQLHRLLREAGGAGHEPESS